MLLEGSPGWGLKGTLFLDAVPGAGQRGPRAFGVALGEIMKVPREP